MPRSGISTNFQLRIIDRAKRISITNKKQRIFSLINNLFFVLIRILFKDIYAAKRYINKYIP